MIPHHPMLFLFLLLCSVPYAHSSSTSRSNWNIWKRIIWKRSSSESRGVPAVGYYNPVNGGGSMLTSVPGTYPPGQGEPLNAIISAQSDAAVLKNQETDGGLINYFLSLGFSPECLGQHSGSDQAANLGDGNGYLNETAVIRWNYGDSQLGSCKETIEGGDHFRYWIQDGSSANSGAIFMGVSYELPLNFDHDIIPNGYNSGRDWLVGNITGFAIPSQNFTNATTFTGTTSWGGYTYQSNITYVTGLDPNTNIGINHNLTVGINGVNASDGFVAVIDVKITGKPQGKSCNVEFFSTILGIRDGVHFDTSYIHITNSPRSRLAAYYDTSTAAGTLNCTTLSSGKWTFDGSAKTIVSLTFRIVLIMIIFHI